MIANCILLTSKDNSLFFPNLAGIVFFLLTLFWPTFSVHASPQENPSQSKGRLIYEQYCSICHGIKGDGKGAVAILFQSSPRSFIQGKYKIKSTPPGYPPLDADLIKSVKFGLPGTAMTPQPHLSDQEIRSVVSYIKDFSSRFSQSKTKKPLTIPPAPLASKERVTQGAEIYQRHCVSCHGQEGKGDGKLGENLSSKPSNLTFRPFKGGSTPKDIVRILLTGIESTAMDSYQFVIEDEDLWNLAYYIDSLGGEPRQTEDERKGKAIIDGLQLQQNKEKS